MKKTMVVLLLSLWAGLSPLVAFAQADEDVKIVPKPQGVVEDSSEHHRMGKKYYLGLKLLGFQAGYYLNRNSLLLMEASRYNWDGYIDSSINSFGIAYKQFTGNSFYYRVGLEHSRVTSSLDSPYTNSGFRLEGTRLDGTIAIGNQWQWQNFTVGVDWVGLRTPIASNVSREDLYGSTSYDLTLSNEKNYWFDRTSLTLLNLNMGFSF